MKKTYLNLGMLALLRSPYPEDPAGGIQEPIGPHNDPGLKAEIFFVPFTKINTFPTFDPESAEVTTDLVLNTGEDIEDCKIIALVDKIDLTAEGIGSVGSIGVNPKLSITVPNVKQGTVFFEKYKNKRGLIIAKDQGGVQVIIGETEGPVRFLPESKLMYSTHKGSEPKAWNYVFEQESPRAPREFTGDITVAV